MEIILGILFIAVVIGVFLPKGRRKNIPRGKTRAPYPPRYKSRFAEPPTDSIAVKDKQITGRAYVIDGDTIVIKKTKIRLAGIDAPELDEPWGQVAKSAMIRICQGGAIRAVLTGGSSYDRVVATCYLPDGADIGAELVKQGLALDIPMFSGGKYRQFETPEARQKLWRVAKKIR